MGTACATTIITKLNSTSAGHTGASWDPFDPELALGTLFEFGSFHKVFKRFVLLTKSFAHPILRTGHTVMIICSTLKTVVFPANQAAVIIEQLIKLKHRWTSRSRAPWSHVVSRLDVLVEWELVKFVENLAFDIGLDVVGGQFACTVFAGTRDFHSVRQDCGFDVLMNALTMVNMSAVWQWGHVFELNVYQTYLALHLLVLKFLLIF